MDSAITTAIITASASIFTCFLGIKAGRTRLFSPYQKEHLERQILELLAPMDKILTFHAVKDWNDIRSELTALIEKNYVLAPPLILSECISLLMCEEITDEQFFRLQTMISSFFNWARREVGYPYDSIKIKKEFSPINEVTETIKALFIALAAVFTVFGTFFAAILLILLSTPVEKYEQVKTGIFVFVILSGLYLCWVYLFRFIKKI